MKKIAFCVIALIFISLSGCEYYSYGLDEFFYRSNTVDKRAENLLNLGNVSVDSSNPYEVLVLTDVHFGGEDHGKAGSRTDDKFFSWLEKTYGTKGDPKGIPPLPKFAICLGDVAEHGLEKEFVRYEAFTSKLESVFGIKTYNVIGNHDLYNAGWDNYEKHCYPYTSFYKFRTEKFTWYFVDSASCSLGNSQLMTFKRDMEYREAGRKKLVFTHVPAYAGGLFYFVMQNTTERNKFISYCAENRVLALVCGHTHKEITSNIGFTEYNLPGYLEKRALGILTVNEGNQTAYMRTVYYLED